jgi:rod shape-determining protein MreD
MTNVRNLHPGAVTAVWLLPLLALLQSTVFGHFAIRGTLPGIVLICVVDWGILRGTDEGMLWAFIAGLCLDVFSGWPPGTSTVSLVTVASLVSLGQGTFIRTHALLPPATVFGSTVLFYCIALFILESTGHPVAWTDAVRDTVIPAAIYNAVLNLAGFRIMERLEHRVYPLPRAQW